MCTQTFFAALFLTDRNGISPKCPPSEKWISTLWYVHGIEYYSASKKDGHTCNIGESQNDDAK